MQNCAHGILVALIENKIDTTCLTPKKLNGLKAHSFLTATSQRDATPHNDNRPTAALSRCHCHWSKQSSIHSIIHLYLHASQIHPASHNVGTLSPLRIDRPHYFGRLCLPVSASSSFLDIFEFFSWIFLFSLRAKFVNCVQQVP